MNYQKHTPNKTGSLQSVTILLIFLMIVINQIFLLSLLAVIIRKIKYVIKSRAKRYYYFVIFYMASKMSLCIYLQIKILSGIKNQFKDIDSLVIQRVFQSSLAIGDCSIIELFFISFEHYVVVSFSVFSNTQTEKITRILMRGLQIITFFVLIVPLLLFNLEIIEYPTLNLMSMIMNCLSVVIFIGAFFFMNFKMTGLMLAKRSTEIIKKVYTLLLALLFSRLLVSALEVWVQINITNGSFQDFISIIEQNQNQQVVLGLCFIIYLVTVMLTEGLPLIMSLRQSIAAALAENARPSPRSVDFEDSIITQTHDEIKNELLNDLDMYEPAEERLSIKQNIGDSYHGVSRIENYDEFEIVQRILSIRDDFLVYKASWKRTNKLYFIKKFKNISSYVIQEILNEVEFYNKLETKLINPIKVLEYSKASEIFLIQKCLQENLVAKLDKMTNSTQKERLQLAIKIAKAIQEFHRITKIGHGVLNPRNIMFDDHQNILFTGFGMQSLKKYLSLTTQYTNLTMYTAVELLGSGRQKKITKASKSSDVYSFGMVLYEIMTGNFKYRDLSLTEIRNKFQKENTRPKISETMNDDLKKLMRKCWQEKPESRPSIQWVISTMEFFKSTI